MIASPCTKVCVMNDATGYCRGCFRTIEEIARWSQMSDDERVQVIDAVAKRGTVAGPAEGSRRPPVT